MEVEQNRADAQKLFQFLQHGNRATAQIMIGKKVAAGSMKQLKGGMTFFQLLGFAAGTLLKIVVGEGQLAAHLVKRAAQLRQFVTSLQVCLT